MKKKIVLFMTFALVFVFGCGSGNKYAYDSFATTESMAEVPMDNGYFAEEYKGFEMEEEQSSYYDTSDRKLIKTVNMTVETENFDDFIANVTAKINELGGYAQEYGQNGQYSYRYANITARIPKQKLEAFLQVIEGKSNIRSKSESVEDVTLQYVDLESHKTALEVEEERLLELMKKAEEISDIIIIEDKLADTRYKLDSMESQLRTYDNKVDFVTVYLYVDEVVRYTPQEELSVWGRIKTGFSENLYDMGQTFTDAFVWFIVYLPNILIIALICVAVLLIIKKVKKKKIKETKEDNKSEK